MHSVLLSRDDRRRRFFKDVVFKRRARWEANGGEGRAFPEALFSDRRALVEHTLADRRDNTCDFVFERHSGERGAHGESLLPNRRHHRQDAYFKQRGDW